jgi:hypothetical protein
MSVMPRTTVMILSALSLVSTMGVATILATSAQANDGHLITIRNHSSHYWRLTGHNLKMVDGDVLSLHHPLQMELTNASTAGHTTSLTFALFEPRSNSEKMVGSVELEGHGGGGLSLRGTPCDGSAHGTHVAHSKLRVTVTCTPASQSGAATHIDVYY